MIIYTDILNYERSRDYLNPSLAFTSKKPLVASMSIVWILNVLLYPVNASEQSQEVAINRSTTLVPCTRATALVPRGHDSRVLSCDSDMSRPIVERRTRDTSSRHLLQQEPRMVVQPLTVPNFELPTEMHSSALDLTLVQPVQAVSSQINVPRNQHLQEVFTNQSTNMHIGTNNFNQSIILDLQQPIDKQIRDLTKEQISSILDDSERQSDRAHPRERHEGESLVAGFLANREGPAIVSAFPNRNSQNEAVFQVLSNCNNLPTSIGRFTVRMPVSGPEFNLQNCALVTLRSLRDSVNAHITAPIINVVVHGEIDQNGRLIIITAYPDV